MSKKDDSRNANEVLKEILGNVTFGEMLSSLRECDEISQKDFAKTLGISKQELCDIERGRKFVSVERAIKFANALGDSPEVFVQFVLQDQIYRAGLNCKVTINPDEAA